MSTQPRSRERVRAVLHVILTTTAMFLATPATLASRDAAPDADLVLRSGTIVTVDPALGTVDALAIRGDRILAAGTNEEIDVFVGRTTRTIDLGGRLAIPGFIDGHAHFVSMGEALMNLDLTVAQSWQEVVDIVAEAVPRAEPGEWIIGRGWHQEKWTAPPPDNVEGFPVHDDLSAVSPDNPVMLKHASGHACCANEHAMTLAGISGATPDPPGGAILRDPQGQPIGVFNETAQSLVTRAMGTGARVDPVERRHRAIELATAECIANGVTSFQDAGSSFDVIDTLREHAEAGALGLRLWVMVREPTEQVRKRIHEYSGIRRVGDGRLTIGGLKRSIDGALGSRGAWLLEPYADSPGNVGLATATVEDVTELARLALAHRLQLCVHAIGDRANREVLDIYEAVVPSVPGGNGLRWRIEHAQHVHPNDIARFGRLGVIASMQGIHCTSDAPRVIARLGRERAGSGAYVWKDLRAGGAVISNGTDAPVEDIDPIACFFATVTRRLADGTVFFGEQRMTRMQALESYTIDAAYAAFEEDVKGTLTPGKYADIVVLSQNILTIPEESIRDARVLMTIVGGHIAHDAR